MSNSKTYYSYFSANKSPGTPLKTESTAYPDQSFSYNLNTNQFGNDKVNLTQSVRLMENSSLLSFKAEEIKKQDISLLLEQTKLVKFISKEVLGQQKIIYCKQKALNALQKNRDQLINKVETIKRRYQQREAQFQRKKQEILLKDKERGNILSYQINALKKSIIRMKSLCSERQYSRNNSSFEGSQLQVSQRDKSIIINSTYHHRRLHSQMTSSKRVVSNKKKKIYVPMYYPYPMPQYYPQLPTYYLPGNGNPQRINLNTKNSFYETQSYQQYRPHYSEKQTNNILSQQQEANQRIKQFNSKLQVLLSEKQSKNVIYSQDVTKQEGSLKNSRKSTLSINQIIKRNSVKTPFYSDDDVILEQTPAKAKPKPQNDYNKLNLKANDKISRREQQAESGGKNRNVNKKSCNINTIEQSQNSAIHISVTSQRKENSSWQKDTIQKYKDNDKYHEPALTPKGNKHQQSLVQIDPRDSELSNIQSIDSNRMLNSNRKSAGRNRLFGSFQHEDEPAHKEELIRSKVVVKQQYKSSIVDLQSSISSKSQTVEGRDLHKKQTDGVQNNIISGNSPQEDDDMIFSINLMPQSNINWSKQNISPQKDVQNEDIIESIRLSTLSRISRERNQKKVSQSQIKTSQLPPEDVRTSVSEVRDSGSNQYRTRASTARDDKSECFDDIEQELRVTTPSRILKKSVVPKRNVKPGLDLIKNSIEEASEEEEANSASQIFMKGNRKSYQRHG